MKTKKLEAVHIGEVKNTKSVDYAEQGLSELVSYIQYIRLTGDALGYFKVFSAGNSLEFSLE